VAVRPEVTLDKSPLPKPTQPELDARQRAVVSHDAGPLLVLAGPGTGKTTTIVESVVARVHSARPIRPEKILVLTFARKAAITLRERIALRLADSQTPWVATFHSFAFAIVRARAQRDENFGASGVAKGSLRLLSAPEEESRVKNVLLDSSRESPQMWGDEWHAALGTRGFAAEVRELLTRARALDVDSEQLGDWGDQNGLPVWASVAQLADIVNKTFALEGVTDYADLIHWATDTARSTHWRATLDLDFDAIYVDEYQDVDPAQVGLLKALFADQTLVVVGDPDQAIYRFRGADVKAIQSFPNDFRQRDGSPSPVIALNTVRRFGSQVLASAQSILPPITSGGLSVDILRDHRRLVCDRAPNEIAGLGPEVAVQVYDTTSNEVSAIADWLRECRNLATGQMVVPWQEMAVIVRTNDEVQRVQAGLLRAGVPAMVSPDDVPLAQHSATRPLLTALDVARKIANGKSEAITGETARALLTGPLGNTDTATLRRAARALREAYREAGLAVPTGDQACANALVDPKNLLSVNDPSVEPIRWLGALLASVAEQIAADCLISQALWALWQGRPSAAQIARFQALGELPSYRDRVYGQAWGRGPEADRANRDIDAVISLFDVAKRDDWREGGRRAIEPFIEDLRAQQFPVESWLESPASGAGVRVLTAHRAKGLEWRCVAVAGVNEGVWPPAVMRGSLLGTERLNEHGVDPPEPFEATLNEERRLLYVAMTRARDRLLVTAVADEDVAGTTPSRFLNHCQPPVEIVKQRSWQTRDPRAFVAYARRLLLDTQTSEKKKQMAAAALAALADSHDSFGKPLFDFADPQNWWGVSPPKVSVMPLRPIDEPVRISGSDVRNLDTCGLKWYLQKEAKGVATRTDALTVGSVIHAFARALYSGELPADPEVVKANMREVWRRLFPKPNWVERSEERTLSDVVERLVSWHNQQRGRVAVAGELGFSEELAVGDDSARLVGRVDRIEVELDSPTGLHVVDFKTGKNRPTKDQAKVDPQLGVYRLATRLGAFDEIVPGAIDAGAELVQLRDAPVGEAYVQQVGSIDDGWVEELLAKVVSDIRHEEFPATPGGHCRFCDYRRLCPTQPAGQPTTGPLPMPSPVSEIDL
jgi:superfamily I DNA/RNA helicase/RecB family exonuclease